MEFDVKRDILYFGNSLTAEMVYVLMIVVDETIKILFVNFKIQLT